MPAPTALKKAEDAPPTDVDMSLPEGTKGCICFESIQLMWNYLGNDGNDAEFILGEENEPPVDMDTVLQPVKDTDEAMTIDEEGRPQFAPSRNIVCLII